MDERPNRDYGLGDAMNDDDLGAASPIEVIESLISASWDDFCEAGDEISVSDDGIPALSQPDAGIVFRTKSHLLIIVRVEVLPEPGYE